MQRDDTKVKTTLTMASGSNAGSRYGSMVVSTRRRGFIARYAQLAIGFLLVVSGHALALVAVLWLVTTESIREVRPPAIEGVLIQMQPPKKEAPPAVVDRQPKPLPVERSRPAPRPKPKSLPDKLPVAPPSERAITAANEPPPPVPVAPEAASMPVVPPRIDASHMKNPAPPYPSLSRRLREEGTVVLELLILVDGTVGEIRVHTSSGYPRLDQSALETVRNWRFVPASKGGEAIAYTYLQPLEFSLNR